MKKNPCNFMFLTLGYKVEIIELVYMVDIRYIYKCMKSNEKVELWEKITAVVVVMLRGYQKGQTKFEMVKKV